MAENVETIYARSLFEVAKETGNLDEIKESLETVAQILDRNTDFSRLLSSPTISKAEKSNIVSVVFDGRSNEYLANFL